MNIALSSGFPNLSLSWKRSEDFCWGLAGRRGGQYSFDGIRAYDHSSSVEPISYISFIRDPLKIISSAIQSVFVFMVNHRKIEGVGDKGYCDKTMDQESFNFSILGKLDLRVSPSITSVLPHSGADIPIFSLPIINNARETQNATKVADLVNPFVSRDVFPLFAGKAFQGWNHFWKKLKDGFFYIKDASFWIGNQITIVNRSRNNSGRDYSPTWISPGGWALSRQSSNPSLIGNFVSTKPRYGHPLLFRHVIHPVSHKNQECNMPSTSTCQVSGLISKIKGL